MPDVSTEPRKELGHVVIYPSENGYIVHSGVSLHFCQWVFNDFRDLTDWLWDNLPQHGRKGTMID